MEVIQPYSIPGYGIPAQSAPPPQPVQPQQQAYSSESKMGQPDMTGIHVVQILLDDEAFSLLKQSSPIFTDVIINAGIKLMSKTNLYKEYLIKDEFKQMNTDSEDLNSTTSVNAAPITIQGSQNTAAASTPIPGIGNGAKPAAATTFASW